MSNGAKPQYTQVQLENDTIQRYTVSFMRHDGVLVSVPDVKREDLEFMAAEEESAGNTALAQELRDLAKGKREEHATSL